MLCILGMQASKISLGLMHWQKRLFVLPQTGTYLPKGCYSYLNIKNKTLPWHGISGLPSSEVWLLVLQKEYISPVLNPQTAHPVAGAGGLAPAACYGLSAGMLLWDTSREWTMSLHCTKKQRRDQGLGEDCREEEKDGWFCEGHATPQGTKACLQQRCWLW